VIETPRQYQVTLEQAARFEKALGADASPAELADELFRAGRCALASQLLDLVAELRQYECDSLRLLVKRWENRAVESLGVEREVYAECTIGLRLLTERFYASPNPAGETSGGPECSSYPPLLLGREAPFREAPLGGPVSEASERGAELQEEPGTLDETPTKRGGE